MIRTLAEKFVSINGEGLYAGLPAVFIRFAGCCLDCSYCDTSWANRPSKSFERLTDEEIAAYVNSRGTEHVTLTGGEPLLQQGLDKLIGLFDNNILAEIETSGSEDIEALLDSKVSEQLVLTLDYKLPSSKMEDYMLEKNYELVRPQDSVKFVAGSEEDLKRAGEVIKKFDLQERCNVFLSPVFGNIEPARLAEFVVEERLSAVRVQVQLHKILWQPDRRGV